MACDPLGMRGLNRPGSQNDKIKIINTMHKDKALSKNFLDDATFETGRNISASLELPHTIDKLM